MYFKYSCFTENTPEMREWLTQIGYYQLASDWMLENPDKLIITNRYCKYFDTIDRCAALQSDGINCLGNPALFKAVTAMREDSDYKQWFVSNDGNEFNLCTKRLNVYSGILCRKATLSELQEHFKKEYPS